MKNVTIKDANRVTVGTYARFPDSEGDIKRKLKDDFGPGKWTLYWPGTTLKDGQRKRRLNQATYYIDGNAQVNQREPEFQTRGNMQGEIKSYTLEKLLDIVAEIRANVAALADDIGEIKAEVFAPDIEDDEDDPPQPTGEIDTPQPEISDAISKLMLNPKYLQFFGGLLTKSQPEELTAHFSEFVSDPQFIPGLINELGPAIQPALAGAMAGMMKG